MRIIDQLTVLQTIRDGKAIGDVKFRAYDAGICDFNGHITPDGERLWHRFEEHLEAGLKKMTAPERLFWVGRYTGDPQPTDADLKDILDHSTSGGLKAAAAKRITDRGVVAPEWRGTLIRLVRTGSDGERRAAIRGIDDETVVADVTDPVALAAWFAGHTPSGALASRLAAGTDGAVVGVLIHALPDDALRSLDIRAMAGTMIYHRDKAAWEFASRADKLTSSQLAALVETGLASVNMLAGSRPLTDTQWAALDRADHEGTQNTLDWRYGDLLDRLAGEYRRLFADPDSSLARRMFEERLGRTHTGEA